MADNDKKGPVDAQASAAPAPTAPSAEAQQTNEAPKFSKACDKYELHPCLQPARMHFPKFGNTEMDLRVVTEAVLDAFVAKHKDQHYFKAKNK